ncbi:sugar kinase [Aquisalinus flavus]|uniref:Ketodeoxygluconokinase n=1 Tax=Aquisalinus flavus TaxID=1526572 RepID=A0A8J2V349_9PROT|nr:sugar kinase [Aquisalinus flavus]MBD0426058.1 sugar kinase [Aquisalinus flavus]UNE48355.1 sugar kinase [Aquisalinus flavus]GGD11044.1 ketodeoxygluconokinase [Aquisalinus flavus]
MKRVLVIGEAMVELRPAGDAGHYASAVAGDVYNTAVYMKRLAGERAQVSFLTALGDDALSQRMRTTFEDERIDTGRVRTVHGGTPGLYMIHTDDQGERSFTYWRSAAAARRMLEGDSLGALTDMLSGFDLVYFSGITLAILPPDEAAMLIAAAEAARARGTAIAFDPNYRARLWDAPELAIVAFDNAFAVSDIALPGMDDERDLYGSQSPAETLDRLKATDPSHIVLKAGRQVHLYTKGEDTQILPVTPVDRPVDTTAAGDSFAAGFLSGWLEGLAPADCVARAARVAAFVVTQPGAICPISAFTSVINQERHS